jgi:hypothetical protein
MSGLLMTMSGPGPLWLPLQDTAKMMGLPLADDQLQGITQGNQPALAAQCAYLPYVIHIDDCVAVNSSELLLF